MTGHGRGQVVFQGRQLVVELQSVNRKQLEIVCALPRALAACEGAVRDFLVPRLSRGRLTVSVQLQAASRSGASSLVDAAAAAAYHRELEALRKKLKIAEPVSLDLVLRGPGVLREGEAALDAAAWRPALLAAAGRAWAAYDKTREAEGRHLAADLLRRLAEIEGEAKKISRRAPRVVAAYRAQLHARIAAAQIEALPGDERLLKEVALFADRCDVSEELTRLGSHFAQFRALLRGGGAAGRTLDFLTQELNREINTVGSKANDAEIARGVVAMKSALEKIREQAQNFE